MFMSFQKVAPPVVEAILSPQSYRCHDKSYYQFLLVLVFRHYPLQLQNMQKHRQTALKPVYIVAC